MKFDEVKQSVNLIAWNMIERKLNERSRNKKKTLNEWTPRERKTTFCTFCVNAKQLPTTKWHTLCTNTITMDGYVCVCECTGFSTKWKATMERTQQWMRPIVSTKQTPVIFSPTTMESFQKNPFHEKSQKPQQTQNTCTKLVCRQHNENHFSSMCAACEFCLLVCLFVCLRVLELCCECVKLKCVCVCACDDWKVQ